MRVNFGRIVLGVLLCASAFSAIGCSSKSEAKAEDPGAQRRAAEAKADAAWKAGDAEQAFRLYTVALKAPASGEPTSALLAKQDDAKRLFGVRMTLASASPGVSSVSSYVQVLEDASADSTEAAAGRKGLIDSLDTYPGDIDREIDDLEKKIKAGEGVSFPFTIRLVADLATDWQKVVAQVPGPTGKHVGAALKHMVAASKSVEKAFKTKYADEALGELAAAHDSIDHAESEIKAAKQSK